MSIESNAIDDNAWIDDNDANSCLPLESTSNARGLLHLGDVLTHDVIEACFRDTFSQRRRKKRTEELAQACGAVWQLQAVRNEAVCFGSMVLVHRDATPTAAESKIRLWFVTAHEFSDVAFVRARPTPACDWLAAFPATAGPLHVAGADVQFTAVVVRIAFPLTLAWLEPFINPVPLWSPPDAEPSDAAEPRKCWVVGFPSAPSVAAVRAAYATADSDVFAIGTVVLDEFHFGELFARQFGGFSKQVVSIGAIAGSAHTANSCGGMNGGAVLVFDKNSGFRLVGLNIGATETGASPTNRFVSVASLRGTQLQQLCA